MVEKERSERDIEDNQIDVQVDLVELGLVIWKRRTLIVSFVVICTISSVFYALQQPDRYISNALLVPVQSGSASRSGAFNISQVSGLGAFDFGSRGRDEKQLALAILTSKQFVEKFLDKNKLVPQLIAAIGWDRAQNQLIYNTKIYNPEIDEWLSEEGAILKPNTADIYSSFIKDLSISDDGDTGYVTISFEHYSPYFVRDILLKLILAINSEMKEKDIGEAQNNIQYLTDLAIETKVVPVQQAIYSLIESEVRRSMLASVKEDYAFEFIDPPVVPETRSEPNRRSIVILGALAGFMLGAFLSIAWYLVNSVKEINPQS